MDKIDVVLDLVREGKITNEQAKILLAEKQDITAPLCPIQPINPWQPSPINPWYYNSPYVVTC